jgi:hypothetical protein
MGKYRNLVVVELAGTNENSVKLMNADGGEDENAIKG